MAKGGEILSQSQVDALLSSIASGSTTAEELKEKDKAGVDEVRNYDFKHPSKFSRDHIQTLRAMHEVFARVFGTQLSAQMRMAVQIDVASIDQLTYDEFIRSISNPTVILLCTLHPMEGDILFEYTPTTAISIIDRILGGQGRAVGRERELTEVEQALVKFVARRGMHGFKDAWKTILPDMEPEIVRIETNSRFVNIVAPTDTVIVISFEIKVGENYGSMRLCLPYTTVEPVVSRMSTQIFISMTSRPEERERALVQVQKNMDEIEVKLSLLLGATDITVSDLLNLQVGDVVSLDSMANDELPIMVEKNCKFYARPGKIGQRMAAQITANLDEENTYPQTHINIRRLER